MSSVTDRDLPPGESVSPKTISVNQDSAISADQVRAELQRILADNVFANAEKMKRFLRFVVLETLEGRGESLNEALVGMEVYSNGNAFDPRIDSTVRVEAGRLRAKLREFYESQGDGGGLRIEIPKGRYGPIFRRPKDTRTNKFVQTSLKKSARARTIAVLPFADMSPQKDQAYFGDGLAEELMFALSRMQSLRVVSQTSVFAFKGKGMDVREIGRQLGVESIMEGSVRKAEQQLRITVRLTEVGTGFQIWSEVFERELKDVFEIQQQISKAVASALRIEVLGEREDLPRCSTTNLSAFNHFLMGRSHWNRQTEAALKAAIGHFEKALAEDPGYGRAHLGISDCLRKLEFWGLMRPSDALPKAREAARRALAVDPTLIEANIPLAAIKATNEWVWAEAEGMFREILKARPDSAPAHQAYAMMCLLPLGRFDEAIDQIQIARRLDPLALLTNAHVGAAYYFAGRYDEAIEQLQTTLELEPNYHLAHLGLAIALEEKGLLNDALATVEKAKSLAGEIVPIWGALGHIYARAGKTREAHAVLGELFALKNVRYISPLDFALLYDGLGRTDEAFDCLDEAAADHCGRLPWALVDPRHRALQSAPRFQALTKRVFPGIQTPASLIGQQ
jgi:serine/threonine-protein kinase